MISKTQLIEILRNLEERETELAELWANAPTKAQKESKARRLRENQAKQSMLITLIGMAEQTQAPT